MEEHILHIALTGHRPNKLAGYDIEQPPYKQLQADLESFIGIQLEKYDKVVCHSGLALGADTIWSKAILSMRDTHPGRVKFHAEVPMLSQPSVWFNERDINFWHEQMDLADEQTIYGHLEGLSKEERKYKAIKLLDERNKGMINHSDMLLAVWDGSKGGTYNAVTYAKKQGVKTYIIKPEKYFNKLKGDYHL